MACIGLMWWCLIKKPLTQCSLIFTPGLQALLGFLSWVFVYIGINLIYVIGALLSVYSFWFCHFFCISTFKATVFLRSMGSFCLLGNVSIWVCCVLTGHSALRQLYSIVTYRSTTCILTRKSKHFQTEKNYDFFVRI